MLDESQLDEFLDEFFGEEKPASDAARLKNSGKQNPFHRKEVPSEELEEYTLPSDGMIIRQMERQGKVSRRTWFAFAVMLIVVPLLLFFSVKIWGGRKYLLCSLIVVVAAMLPFFMMFEGRKPKAREIMVISVLAAIGVAGRAAFFMVPSFKPVAAIVILTGISFGGEAGFLVGSLTMLISNMFMGQGPWTPWQMFAFGIVGFLGGLIFRRKRGKWKHFHLWLCIYGGLSVLVIYGFLLDTASVFMGMGGINKAAFLAMYASGFPMNVIHGSATVIFLAVLGEPMLAKLQRIRKKYGILEP